MADEPHLVDTLVQGATVITVDRERRIFRDGTIAIQDGRIVAVGRTADLLPRYRGRRVIDARGKVVTPGFIDAHVHVSAEQALKGLVPDDAPPRVWVRDWIVPMYSAMTPEEEYLTALFTFIELIRTGTTCFVEAGTTKYTPRIIAAMAKVGIRGCVGKWSWDIPRQPANLYQTAEEAIASNEQLIRDYHNALNGRVKVWTSPIGHTMTSDALLQGLKALADRYQTGMTMHLSSWIEDVEGYLERTGLRPVQYYERLGVLGPNVLLAHMVNLDDAEIELVLKYDVKIAHCPTTAFWFGYGLSQVSKFPELIDRGATIALGCDAANCSNHFDMVRAMYTSAGIFRDARRNMGAMPAERMVEMATLHGARAALQEADLGSLEAGKKADLVIFNTRRSEWVPVFNPITNLVFSADGHSVETVLIDGQAVLEGGRVTTVDEFEVYDEIQKLGERVRERIGLPIQVRWPIID